MLKYLSILGLLLASQTITGPDHPEWIFAEIDGRNVSGGYRQQADCILIPVTITTWVWNLRPSQQVKQKAMDIISAKAVDNKDIIIFTGPPPDNSLPAAKNSKMTSSGHKSHEADLYVMVRFKGAGRGAADCVSMMRQFLNSLSLPDKAKLHFGRVRLVVEKPEQYRSKVLEMITKNISKTREALNNEKVTVHGLEGPIRARQVDDATVEFFIDYKISAEL